MYKYLLHQSSNNGYIQLFDNIFCKHSNTNQTNNSLHYWDGYDDILSNLGTSYARNL